MSPHAIGKLKIALVVTVVVVVASVAQGHAADEAPAGEHAAAVPEHPAAAPGEGHGEGHGESHGIDPKSLALQLLNFAALLFVLIKFGGGAVNKALKARHEQLKVSIEEAARLRATAAERLGEQEKRVANLAQEIAAMRASMKQGADLERTRLLATAEEKAKRIQEETTFLLGQQVKQAELRFRNEVAEASVKIAEELLKRSVDGQDEKRLASGFVADVGTN